MLIGAGAGGDATQGGGSGAVTVWYGMAQNISDNLIITAGLGFGTPVNTTVSARFSNSGATPTALLTANAAAASGGTGGTAMTANQFSNTGFFQSVAGQNGSTGDPGASSTTFLSGGSLNTTTGNYGYVNTKPDAAGYFQLQPIIVGVGGSGSATGTGGYGCGAGYNSGGVGGGRGLVLIASW